MSIVNRGALARMGAVRLSGMRAIALNVKAQLPVTSNAFKITSPCSTGETRGTFPKNRNGRKTAAPVKLQKKRTGHTAFESRALFLAMSYRPRKSAEKSASVIQNISLKIKRLTAPTKSEKKCKSYSVLFSGAPDGHSRKTSR